MTDEIDRAQEREELDRDLALRAAAKPMPAGDPGECEYCWRDLPRIVGGACGACRDKYRLP